MRKCLQSLLVLLLVSFSAHAQINAYANVTANSGTPPTLTLSNVNESYGTFEVGDYAIIMQVQCDVSFTTTNISTFGTLTNIRSAGYWEVVKIQSMTESGGVPTGVTVTVALTRTYRINTSSVVQLISFPRLGGGSDYTTTANMNALDWNGSVGGVLACYVEGTLNLNHDISADGAGFVGASGNGGGSAVCTSTTYRTITGEDYADKGEGIYNNTAANYVAARGKILNGGGGGNSHNAGGGGGGNYTVGGNGGPGYGCSPTCGGYGGINLNGYISSSRLYFGGGAGAGEGNNSGGSAGGNGGGIILLKADKIKTSGTCSARKITANGDAGIDASQDGAGGGGAGGSILLEVDTFEINSGCPLQIQANGANGGNVVHADQHGGGGGGGQGTVIFTITEPTTNITTTTAPGTGGENSIGGSHAGDGGGTSGDGIIDGVSSPLPIELLSFNAEPIGRNVWITWTTASETNNHYFAVERSQDAYFWEKVADVLGAGYSNVILDYKVIDYKPYPGLSYYRLTQTDYDGKSETFPIVAVNLDIVPSLITIYPNPALNQVNIDFGRKVEKAGVKIMNTSLQEIAAINLHNCFETQLDISDIDKGMYYIRIITENENEIRKLIIQ